jgi:hypothetical protein
MLPSREIPITIEKNPSRKPRGNCRNRQIAILDKNEPDLWAFFDSAIFGVGELPQREHAFPAREETIKAVFTGFS